MDYSKQIFKMLDIEPEEEFYLDGRSTSRIYKIFEDLTPAYKDDNVSFWTPDFDLLYEILTGKTKIKKKINFTQAEQLAIDYAKACGYKYLAKDEDEEVFAYNEKPSKLCTIWDAPSACLKIDIPISFISFKDNEPYEI